MSHLFLMLSLLCAFSRAEIPSTGSILLVLPLARKAFESVPTSGTPRFLSSISSLRKTMWDYTRAKCRKANQPSCEIHYGGVGTAFLLNNSRTLWTAAHNFGLVTMQPVHDGKADFILVDPRKGVVFDSTTDGAGVLNLMASYNENTYAMDSATDFVRITLPKNIVGTPLRLSPVPPKPGDTLAVISDEGVMPRTGRAMGTKELELSSVKHGLRWDANVAKSFERMKNDFVFLDYPAAEGMSGGPVLNATNEVVGIIAKGHIFENDQTGYTWAISAKRMQALEIFKPSN